MGAPLGSVSGLNEAYTVIYRHTGHLTVPGVFADQDMDEMVGDIERWGEEFLAELPQVQRGWYIDGGVKAKAVLRKLDNPHAHREQALSLARQPMTPSPVLKGGVSFHHGNTFHQSGPNLSARWRRACALHYVRNDVVFATPALPYDHSLKRRIT